MSDGPGEDEVQHGRELQAKLDMYLQGLTFTLLGLAVQTAKFGSSRIADALELLGWLALIVSGVAGLSRLQWVPVMYTTHGKLRAVRHRYKQLVRASQFQVTAIPDPEIQYLTRDEIITETAKCKVRIHRLEQEDDQLSRSGILKLLAHKWLFVCGLILLAIARGYSPARVVLLNEYPAISSEPAKQVAPPPAVERAQ